MKKIISFIFLFLSVLLFLITYLYTETNLINEAGYFNYHIGDFLGYLFFWFLVLFIFSLLALKLDQVKYKIWLLLSVITAFTAVLFAYGVGGGNGAIIDIDGELVTWFFLGLYSLISIIYFTVQFFKNSTNKTVV